MLNLVDHFGGTFLIFVILIVEIVGVIWIYGLRNIVNDVEFMIAKRPGPYWRLCWSLITPFILIAIFIYSMVTMKPLLYADTPYPDAAYGNLFNQYEPCYGILYFVIYSRRMDILPDRSVSNSIVGAHNSKVAQSVVGKHKNGDQAKSKLATKSERNLSKVERKPGNYRRIKAERRGDWETISG